MRQRFPRPLCTQEFMEDQDRRDKLLQDVSNKILIRLLRSAAIEYPEFAVRIEAAALAQDPRALEAYLGRSIENLPRPDDWLADDDGEEYTKLWLDPILEAVREDLLPSDPAAAARILCQFLSRDEAILQRVDSSYGCISIRVSWITEMLIAAAKQVPAETLAALQDIQRADNDLWFRKKVLQDVTTAVSPPEP